MSKAKQPKTSQKKLSKSLKSQVLPFAFLFLFLFSALFAFYYYYSDRILASVYVAGINVGGKTEAEALSLLKDQIVISEKINLKAKDQSFDLSLADVGFSYNFQQTVDEAYKARRSGTAFENLSSQITSVWKPVHIPISASVNDIKIDEYLAIISTKAATLPVAPAVSLENNQVIVENGAAGEYADSEAFKNKLIANLSAGIFDEITVPFVSDDSSLSDEEAEILKTRAETLRGKTIAVTNEHQTFLLKEREIYSFLNGKTTNATQGLYNTKSILSYLESEIEPKVNRPPQNAVFTFEEGRVTEFKPAKDGLTLNKESLLQKLTENLELLESTDAKTASVEVPVESKSPDITTDKVNDLGIKELIGRGTSVFKGSISGRIFNVGHAAAKFNGVLIPPGADFSFNQTLGDVSSLTGYKQAYVIKDGRTVLGDGGGVCQVSTTLFRAILNAGLPITERRAHSYRVGYYEQDAGPGLDATVFAPTTDLKFKNDTPGHLLIQTQFDSKNMTLVFEIYGTSDGRVATTTKPVILSSSQPPEDLYIDDPNIPAGQVRQIEHKAWGARVSFDHKVERNGEVIYEKTFLSNYRPWGAVFMRGTGPAI